DHTRRPAHPGTRQRQCLVAGNRPRRPAPVAQRAGMTDGITHWDGPPLEAWEPWTPATAARALAGVEVPWCVVGGWAIDLFLGRETRHHEDLEIAVPRLFFAPLRQQLDRHFALHVVGDGEVRRLSPGAPYP